CTHYPLLKGVIAEVVGPGVTLVDSAEATAEAVAELLSQREWLAPEGGTPTHGYYVTDVPERFVEVGARFLGRPIPSAEQVDLSF
ncbi:MAG TPA: glutamate racemase, partial [Archangium sp.]|nr:glutamate racemase [Archangium sp.]